MAKTKTHIKLKVRIPHVIVDARKADPELVEKMVEGLRELDAKVRVLGGTVKRMPHVFSFEQALEEADLWVFLSEELPSDFNLLIKRGIVPVMMEGAHPLGENYWPVKEQGNAFLFPELSPWRVYGSLVRALENFNFIYDWQSLKDNGKELLFS